jgi:hypothetical protein
MFEVSVWDDQHLGLPKSHAQSEEYWSNLEREDLFEVSQPLRRSTTRKGAMWNRGLSKEASDNSCKRRHTTVSLAIRDLPNWKE